MQTLEKKLLAQQEELTELHKRKGENAQKIVDLNAKLLEREQLTTDQAATIKSLRAEVRMLSLNEQELKLQNDTLRDEHTALHLAFNALEEKLRKAQDDNTKLLEKIAQNEKRILDKLNEENEMIQRLVTRTIHRRIKGLIANDRGLSF